MLIGQGWDESLWPEGRPPTGEELERAAPGMRTLLSRIDGHSSIVSPALVDAVPGLEGEDGWTGGGRVERDAHHAVRAVMGELVGSGQRLDAARVACARMTANGLAGFHENAAPHIGPDYEVDLVRRAAQEAGLRATVYWGELGAIDTARRLGASGLAGDLNADGALGSRTAALHAPYADRPDTRGHGYLSAEQIAEHVALCTEAGLQAGFHCIGDAALDAIGDGFALAADKLGDDRVRAARHRLEHVEMPSQRVIDVLARLDVTASVQPMFDALWGGPDGMYADRLGERWDGDQPVPRSARWRRSGWLSAPTLPSPRSARGRPCAPPCTTTRPSTGWARAGPSGRTPLAAGRPVATTTPDSCCPAAGPTWRSGSCPPGWVLTAFPSSNRAPNSRDWCAPSAPGVPSTTPR